MLDWEEGLFRGGLALVESLWSGPRRRRSEAAKARLAGRRHEWFYLAHFLAGGRIAFFVTDERVLRLGNRICLPAESGLHADRDLNAEFYLVKTALAALSIRMGCRPGETPSGHFARLRDGIGDEIPGLAGAVDRQWNALRPSDPGAETFGRVAPDPEPSGRETQGDASGEGEREAGPGPESVTEREGRGRTGVETVQTGDLRAEAVPQHAFEKIETLEEYDGLNRDLDGADELAAHADALDEVDMRHVVRTRERSRSVYRADMALSPLSLELPGEAPGRGLPYPEWDYRKRAYRGNWCFVRRAEPDREDPDWAREAGTRLEGTLKLLKKRLARFSAETLRAKARPDGDEFDLEALVDDLTRIKAGTAPDENIYLRKRRDLADIATLILVDLSDSTDAWLEGRHVLDIIKESLLCIGGTLDEFTREFAIAGFASDTRRACSYIPIKDFDGDWGPVPARIGGLAPRGYTRIGAAMRHATALLRPRAAARKAILLIGDGRPCDYDQYEGRYGIADVKRAFEEARKERVLCHAFAIDKRAREHFPAMFPANSFHVIAKPADLSDSVFRFFQRLKAAG